MILNSHVDNQTTHLFFVYVKSKKKLKMLQPCNIKPLYAKSLIPLKRPETPHHSNSVPRIIWRTWKDDSWKTQCRSSYIWTHYKKGAQWAQTVMTDTQCRQFIQDTFQDPRILEAYDACNYGVMRADLWRYLILYWYGGVYLDMKSRVLQSLTLLFDKPCTSNSNSTLNSKTKQPSSNTSKMSPQIPRVFTSPWNLSKYGIFHKHLFRIGEFQQFWIAAEPGAPALWRVIQQVVGNILFAKRVQNETKVPFLFLPETDCTKSRIVSMTGPIPYTFSLLQMQQEVPESVCILKHDANQCIEYWPPVRNESSSLRADHYSKQTKPLLIYT